VPAGDWINQLFLVRAEANYALGRAYLSKLSREESRVEDPHLALAVRHLEKALEFDPRHDYACFRLGFAKRNQNDAGGALMAYGRAVAIGGVAAGPAMQQLEEVLGIVKEVLPDSPWARKTAQDIVNEANSLIQTELARVQTEKTTAAAEIESREPPPSADQSAGPGTTPG
jgi:tetratricopeptide (TPR) repeat protein